MVAFHYCRLAPTLASTIAGAPKPVAVVESRSGRSSVQVELHVELIDTTFTEHSAF
jgi:hypothetical protein